MTTTTLSTKGQVILPKKMRDARRWKAGTRLTVEETADGVLLRAEATFPHTDPEQVFGALKQPGVTRSIEEMHIAIGKEAQRRARAGH